MPKAVHDLAIKLQGKGKSEDSAWAIANSQLGKTTKNDKSVGEIMDQSPSMTNLAPSPQNSGGWPTSPNPSFGNEMGQMREDGIPCDICGGPEHPPMDHPYLPRMPNDPMAMTQQPPMPMPPLPMQAPSLMQPPTPPPMQTNPAQTQAPPGQNEGGMGSGQYPHASGGGAQQSPSGGGQSGGGSGGEGGFGSPSMGGQKAPPGPIMSFETVSIPGGLSAQSVGAKKMNEAIFKQVLDKKAGCRCQNFKKG